MITTIIKCIISMALLMTPGFRLTGIGVALTGFTPRFGIIVTVFGFIADMIMKSCGI